ncbi:MAG: flagellar hook-basal body complex protein FliE [Aliihoeflea sp.]|jgi:flagellar hook-basal body complex protein FliE
MQGLFAVARIGTQNITPEFSPVQQTPQVGATTFAEELQARLATTAANLGTAETMAIGAIRGEVDRREVVDAVMSAEQSLQAAIAIRDKIVQAYLEVSRMQI